MDALGGLSGASGGGGVGGGSDGGAGGWCATSSSASLRAGERKTKHARDERELENVNATQLGAV
jgi:hypothetical protein